MKGSEVAITIRFVNDAEKRNIKLFVPPSIKLSELSQQLAKQTGVEIEAEGKKIQFSLEGRSLDSYGMTLQQAYSGALFAVILDARVVEEEVNGKKEEGKKSRVFSRPARAMPPSPLTPQAAASPHAREAEANFSVPEHPGSKLVNEDRHDEELQCKICTFPCLDPVVLPCCENLTCRACLRDKSCPFDRAPIKSLKEPQRIIRNMLERVEVQCLACQLIMKRGLKGEVFQKHVDQDCPLQCIWGCEIMLTRATMAGHEVVCTEVIVACSAADAGCGFLCARGVINDHEASCRSVEFAPFLRRISALESWVFKQQSQILPFLALRKNLENCTELKGFDFKGQDATSLVWKKVDLSFCDFSRADLTSASVSESTFESTLFSGACLKGCSLNGMVSNCCFKDGQLLVSGVAKGCTFSSCTLTLSGTFVNCTFTTCTLTVSGTFHTFDDCTFAACTLTVSGTFRCCTFDQSDLVQTGGEIFGVQKSIFRKGSISSRTLTCEGCTIEEVLFHKGSFGVSSWLDCCFRNCVVKDAVGFDKMEWAGVSWCRFCFTCNPSRKEDGCTQKRSHSFNRIYGDEYRCRECDYKCYFCSTCQCNRNTNCISPHNI